MAPSLHQVRLGGNAWGARNAVAAANVSHASHISFFLLQAMAGAAQQTSLAGKPLVNRRPSQRNARGQKMVGLPTLLHCMF